MKELKVVIQDSKWKTNQDNLLKKQITDAKNKFKAANNKLVNESKALTKKLEQELSKAKTAEEAKRLAIIKSIKIPTEKESEGNWKEMWTKLQKTVSVERKEYNNLLDVQKDYNTKLAHLKNLKSRIHKLNAKVHITNDETFDGVFEQIQNSLTAGSESIEEDVVDDVTSQRLKKMEDRLQKFLKMEPNRMNQGTKSKTITVTKFLPYCVQQVKGDKKGL